MVTRIAPRTHVELPRSSTGTAVRPRDAVAGRDDSERPPALRAGPVLRARAGFGRPTVRGARPATLFELAGVEPGSDGQPSGLGVAG